MIPANNPAANNSLSSDPYPIFQRNFFNHKIESCFGIIMIAREKHTSLRQTNIVPDSYFSKIVDPNIFTNPAMVSCCKKPGILDRHPWLYNHSLPHPCSKQPEKKDFQPRKGK